MNLGLLKHIGPAIYPQLVEMNKYFANIVWFINFGIDNLYYRPTIKYKSQILNSPWRGVET